MDMECVVFRLEKDQYNARENILAVFPDDPANPGRYAAVPFHYCGDTTIFEPYCEIDRRYYLNTKPVHKDTPVAERALRAIEQRYGTPFRVMEKITG